MKTREDIIRLWFGMWLEGKDKGIIDIFTGDCLYIESWGPQYCGSENVKYWFDEWNTRAKVLQWDIRQFFHKENQTVVEWYFHNSMDGGREEKFEGMSLIRWTEDNRIEYLQEFGCNILRYNPYGEEGISESGNEDIKWF
ncbi:MAG TPA: conjugal transfer protein [Dysgonomonas sp.]|nr:conjugal transfer protein [Dysgonomonas sp.]